MDQPDCCSINGLQSPPAVSYKWQDALRPCLHKVSASCNTDGTFTLVNPARLAAAAAATLYAPTSTLHGRQPMAVCVRFVVMTGVARTNRSRAAAAAAASAGRAIASTETKNHQHRQQVRMLLQGTTSPLSTLLQHLQHQHYPMVPATATASQGACRCLSASAAVPCCVTRTA